MSLKLSSRARSAPALIASSLVLLASPLAACQFSASTGGLDYGKLETAITDELNKSYSSISQKVSSVDCPEQSPGPAKGDKFVCTADVAAQKVRVETTVTDDDYNVHFGTMDTLYALPEVATSLTGQLSDQLGFPVTVDCGEGFTEARHARYGSPRLPSARTTSGSSSTRRSTAPRLELDTSTRRPAPERRYPRCSPAPSEVAVANVATVDDRDVGRRGETTFRDAGTSAPSCSISRASSASRRSPTAVISGLP